MNSYRVEVRTAQDDWTGNGVRHSTREAAENAARDLFSRWTAVTEWRVVESEDQPNDRRAS